MCIYHSIEVIAVAHPGHGHAAGDHPAELHDVGVHLVPPPLLYLAVVLLEAPPLLAVVPRPGLQLGVGGEAALPVVLTLETVLGSPLALWRMQSYLVTSHLVGTTVQSINVIFRSRTARCFISIELSILLKQIADL